MNHVAQLNSLGWLWRQNGVELCVTLDGRSYRVFVPLGRVVMTFQQELAREGYAEPPSVGDFSVGGLFGKIGRAFGSIGKGASRAVSRAATGIRRQASKWGSKVAQGAVALGQNKFVRGGLAAASLAMPALAPAAIALETANRAYDTAQQARRFVRRPSFGGALGLASQAAPGPYGAVARQATQALPSPRAASMLKRMGMFEAARRMGQR